jgi:hypothetical protein
LADPKDADRAGGHGSAGEGGLKAFAPLRHLGFNWVDHTIFQIGLQDI